MVYSFYWYEINLFCELNYLSKIIIRNNGGSSQQAFSARIHLRFCKNTGAGTVEPRPSSSASGINKNECVLYKSHSH